MSSVGSGDLNKKVSTASSFGPASHKSCLGRIQGRMRKARAPPRMRSPPRQKEKSRESKKGKENPEGAGREGLAREQASPPLAPSHARPHSCERTVSAAQLAHSGKAVSAQDGGRPEEGGASMTGQGLQQPFSEAPVSCISHIPMSQNVVLDSIHVRDRPQNRHPHACVSARLPADPASPLARL